MPSCNGHPPNNGLRWIALLLCLLPALARGETVLSGRAEQGGLLVGQGEPGLILRLDDRPVPVDETGRFLLGFGRDASAQARLDILHADGERESRLLTVARRDWTVQRIEGLPRDKAEPDPLAVARIRAESEMLRGLRGRITLAPLYLSGLVPPAGGIVSGIFGSQRVYNGNAGAPHSGLDIAAAAGTPVRAAAEGVVVLAAPDLFLTGRTVMIDHGLGLMSSYAHLSAIAVEPGRHVARGEVIGAVGASGLATGAHLHWGMSWLDVRIDPETALAVLGLPRR